MSITVLTDQGEQPFASIADAEAALTEGGWEPRKRQPGQWVKLSPHPGNRFASVYDSDLQPAYTTGLTAEWTAATVASNLRVVYTVTVNGETHRFPGWHAAELMAREFNSEVIIYTAASQSRS